MKEELICEIVVENYHRTIVQSAKTKEKNIIKEELKKPIPLKYCDSVIYKHTGERIIDGNTYYWKPKKLTRKGKGVILHVLSDYDGNNVIANPRAAGNQKLKIINGSDLFRLNLPIYTMTKIKNELKKVFIEALKDVKAIKPEQYPIIVKA
jgi:hypothetical protein